MTGMETTPPLNDSERPPSELLDVESIPLTSGEFRCLTMALTARSRPPSESELLDTDRPLRS